MFQRTKQKWKSGNKIISFIPKPFFEFLKMKSPSIVNYLAGYLSHKNNKYGKKIKKLICKLIH